MNEKQRTKVLDLLRSRKPKRFSITKATALCSINNAYVDRESDPKWFSERGVSVMDNGSSIVMWVE